MSVATRVRTLVAAATVFGLAFLGAGSAVAAPSPAPDTLPPLTSHRSERAARPDPTPLQPTVDPLCQLKRLHFTFKDPLSTAADKQVSEQYLPTDDGKQPRQGMSAVMPATPQHETVRFLGWFYAGENGEAGDVPFDPQHPAARDYNATQGFDTEVPVVAKYDDSVPVTFHNKSGEHDIIEGVVRVPRGQPVTQGDRTAPRAKAAASGHYLEGWRKGSASGQAWNLGTDPVQGPTDLYAHFIDGRTVTFDTAGGSFVPVHVMDKTEKFDPDDPHQSDKPKRAGYKFLYWSLDPAGSKPQRQFHRDDTPTDGNGFTLHAVWQPVKVPYALVYMRETVPQGIPGPDYEPQYVVDSVDTSQALTDSDAPVVEKTIQEPSEVRDGKQTYLTFVLDKERTDKKAVKVKGDGSSVKYVYYDRPRQNLTYQARISPDNYQYGDPENPFPGGAQGTGNRLITKVFHNVIAGTAQAPYQEEFLKIWRKAVAASPKAMQAWYQRTHSRNPDDFGMLFQENPRSYTFFIYPPYMPGRDLFLYGKFVGTSKLAYNYVEVDPRRRGEGALPGGKYLGTTWNVNAPLGSTGKVLNQYSNDNWQPVHPGEFWPGRYVFSAIPDATPTDEDFVPVRGFKTLETSDNYWAATNGNPSRSAFSEYVDGKQINNIIIRYVRLKYPLDLRANGGPGGDRKTDVLYDDPLNGKLPYTIDQTVRDSDRAVFKGWYRDPKFVGEPVDAVHEKMPYHGLVLYAKWEVPKVTVNYHDWDPKDPRAGELFHSEEHDKYTDLDTLHAPNVPQNTDAAEFQGWRRYNRQGYLVPVSPGMRLVKDTYDLYPAWPLHDVDLVYHLGGGSGRVPDTSAARYRPHRNNMIQPAPNLVPPAGKVLLGWRVRGDKRNIVYKPGDLFPVEPIAEDGKVHLDPVWGPAAPTATITYHPNGGDGQPVTVEYPAWGREDFDAHPRPSFEWKDHAMRGWGRKGDPADAPTLECENALYLPPGGSHLYALWDVSAVTVHIRKVDEQGQPLIGAEFRLYYDRGMRQPVDTRVQAAPDGSSYAALSIPTSSVDSNSITYWLAETKAPPGHELMPVPVGFTLRKVPTVSMSLVEPDTLPNVKLQGTTLTIANVPAGHLPAAGGAGHWPYYAAGALALVGAALTARRRRQRS